MKGKLVFAGLLVAAVVMSGLGLAVMAQQRSATMSEKELDCIGLRAAESADPEAKYLLTAEQIETMKAEAQELRDAHATRTEIRETVQDMAHGYVQVNLESYGLAEEEIGPIQARLDELVEKNLEIRERAYELWGLDMNRQDIRAELQPLIDEACEIRRDLKAMLDEHGILPPEMDHPGTGAGRCRGRGIFGMAP
jgi:hypothetical protein